MVIVAGHSTRSLEGIVKPSRILIGTARILVALCGVALFLVSLVMIPAVLVNLPDSWLGVIWVAVLFFIGGGLIYMTAFDWPPKRNRGSNAF
jgi:hypothetical protein